MCYLINDICYYRLYGASTDSVPAETVVHLLTNYFRPRLVAISADLKYFTPQELSAGVPGSILGIIDDLLVDLGDSDITFRDVYTDRKNQPNTDEAKVKERFTDIYCLKREFCFPFIIDTFDFENEPHNRVDKLLRIAGHWSMYELYAKPKWLLLQQSGQYDPDDVRDASRLPITCPEDEAQPGLIPMVTPGYTCENPNYARCNSSEECTEVDTADYCNSAEDDRCSATSGNCPP